MLMKMSALVVGASLAIATSAYAQAGGRAYEGANSGARSAPAQSTTAGDVSPPSGGNGGIGGTPGNAAAAGTSAGPGSTGSGADSAVGR